MIRRAPASCQPSLPFHPKPFSSGIPQLQPDRSPSLYAFCVSAFWTSDSPARFLATLWCRSNAKRLPLNVGGSDHITPQALQASGRFAPPRSQISHRITLIAPSDVQTEIYPLKPLAHSTSLTTTSENSHNPAEFLRHVRESAALTPFQVNVVQQRSCSLRH